MGRKKDKNEAASSAEPSQRLERTSLPSDLEERLRVVWRRIGHLVDWCESNGAWTKQFYSEARPYRQTFYWEAVAEIVSDHMLDHPEANPTDVLTDCLVATQYSASPDDRQRLAELRGMWAEILGDSRTEIEAFIQADLQLAAQECNYETVARLYATDHGRWKKTEGDEVE